MFVLRIVIKVIVNLTINIFQTITGLRGVRRIYNTSFLLFIIAGI